jgi:predicted DNA-binding ribbon-helix-helix protein
MSESTGTASHFLCRCHSLRRGRRVTSIRLENAFWDVLAEMAAERGLSLNQLIAETTAAAGVAVGDITNQASLLRVACVRYLKTRDAGWPLARQVA